MVISQGEAAPLLPKKRVFAPKSLRQDILFPLAIKKKKNYKT
jgi:hypothetical protein